MCAFFVWRHDLKWAYSMGYVLVPFLNGQFFYIAVAIVWPSPQKTIPQMIFKTYGFRMGSELVCLVFEPPNITSDNYFH